MSDAAAADPRWYARPVVAVTDVGRALDFYIDGLGFRRDWGSEQDGKPDVVQVSRGGCELILCAHWPERVGQSLVFVSLETAVLAALRSDLASKAVPTEDGWWGYDLTVVRDPDGNTLYFPHEATSASQATQ